MKEIIDLFLQPNLPGNPLHAVAAVGVLGAGLLAFEVLFYGTLWLNGRLYAFLGLGGGNG